MGSTLPRGRRASWLSTLVLRGHRHIRSVTGRNAPGFPSSPPPCWGHQEVAMGGHASQCPCDLRKGAVYSGDTDELEKGHMRPPIV